MELNQLIYYVSHPLGNETSAEWKRSRQVEISSNFRSFPSSVYISENSSAVDFYNSAKIPFSRSPCRVPDPTKKKDRLV
jgi:hypothetical protein